MNHGLERAFIWFSRWAAAFAAGAVLTLILFLAHRGLQTLGPTLLFGNTPVREAITGRAMVWDGLWPACVGTLCLVFSSCVMAIPVGLAAGIYLAEYASTRQRALVGAAVEILAGTPSVLMGLFGFALILFLRRTLVPQANTSLLLAAVCLGLLVLPYLILATRTSLEGLPASLRLTGLGLGLDHWQSIRWLLLPAASRGILSGVILAVGRAAEDTAIILLTGVVADAGLPRGLSDRFSALPFHIYYVVSEHRTQAELDQGFGAALVLLLLTAILFGGASLLRRRMKNL
jgi:phosphate transport system permease protein